MAFLDVFRSKPKRASGGNRKSFIFPSQGQGEQFAHTISTGNNSLLDFIRLNNLAGQFGGELVHSTLYRELTTYGYLEHVRENDIRYLIKRDPTAKFIVEQPAKDTWSRLPLTNIETIDSFMATLSALDLPRRGATGQREANITGGALLYLETTGRQSTTVAQGQAPVAWHILPRDRILWHDNNNDATKEPVMAKRPTPLTRDHGIEKVWVFLTEEDKAAGRARAIHGSRLFPVTEDLSAKSWLGVPQLESIHDDLWNLRDILWSRTRAHFEGDPIIVEVDLSDNAIEILNIAGMSDTQRKAMKADVVSAIQKFRSGETDTFAPLLGFNMKRLGAAKLPDPKEDIAALASRISHGTHFPVKMLLASTKGQSDVEDQDILTYAANIQRVRDLVVYPIISKLVRIGKIMGRIPVEDALPPTQELVWPPIRPLTPRDEAFILKTESAVARQQWERGHTIPAHIARKFPKDESIDLPPLLAGKGRLEDGTSADSSSDGPQPPFSEQRLLDEIEERLKRELDEALEDWDGGRSG